jgi:hypothetical protein
MDKNSFSTVNFLGGRVHRVLDAQIIRLITDTIPASVISREPRIVARKDLDRLPMSDYCVTARPEGERCLLVLCRVRGVKMCCLVTSKDTLVVRLHINRNEPYDLGSVFEGYFHAESGIGMTFDVTDALKLEGVFLNKVPYAMRKLAAIVFCSKTQSLPDSPLVMCLPLEIPHDQISTCDEPLLLHPKLGDFEDEVLYKTYIEVH